MNMTSSTYFRCDGDVRCECDKYRCHTKITIVYSRSDLLWTLFIALDKLSIINNKRLSVNSMRTDDAMERYTEYEIENDLRTWAQLEGERFRF